MKLDIFTQFGIAPADQALMESKMRPVGFAKGQTLEDPTSDQRYIYFIKQGILRVYHYNQDDEINTYLQLKTTIYRPLAP
ncbi:MAG: hypothetical protein COB13_011720 [OCS116 cluster bacterium]|nr:hypothetical protein [OCS116 cluster bacterium]